MEIDKATLIRNLEIAHLEVLMKNYEGVKSQLIENYWIMHSPITTKKKEYKDTVILITQFYISADPLRHAEILKCLEFNLSNSLIDTIYLITEKYYSDEDMNIVNNLNKSKVIQINIGQRMKYSDAFDIIESNSINGYIIVANSDIFFDSTLVNLYTSGLHINKKIFSQLRFEYTNTDLSACSIFGPRGDSQDTWIFHSNNNISKPCRKLFNFQLGIPACDNHILYLFMILGYKVHNEPYLIKTYHNHQTEVRTYDETTTRVVKPWIRLMPIVHEHIEPWVKPNNKWWRFNISYENTELGKYINKKLSSNQPFILPRIAGVENNFVEIGIAVMQNQASEAQKMYLQKANATMKNNAGIKLSSMMSIINYSLMYISAFEKCDAYFEWEVWGNVYRYISSSHNFITMNFPKKKQFWAFTLDVFHNIYNEPWTRALRGKRLLIVSPFVKSMQEKLDILPEIYGIDLFPDCSFVFIKPPQTQGDIESEEFDIELQDFMDEVEEIKDEFDIALCSCGGYGNLVCAKIFDMGKSAIYVGGVLQMYFGIYGSRWLRERPDILRLFMNKHWSRPKEEEQPDGFKKVEGSCYW